MAEWANSVISLFSVRKWIDEYFQDIINDLDLACEAFSIEIEKNNEKFSDMFDAITYRNQLRHNVEQRRTIMVEILNAIKEEALKVAAAEDFSGLKPENITKQELLMRMTKQFYFLIKAEHFHSTSRIDADTADRVFDANRVMGYLVSTDRWMSKAQLNGFIRTFIEPFDQNVLELDEEEIENDNSTKQIDFPLDITNWLFDLNEQRGWPAPGACIFRIENKTRNIIGIFSNLQRYVNQKYQVPNILSIPFENLVHIDKLTFKSPANDTFRFKPDIEHLFEHIARMKVSFKIENADGTMIDLAVSGRFLGFRPENLRAVEHIDLELCANGGDFASDAFRILENLSIKKLKIISRSAFLRENAFRLLTRLEGLALLRDLSVNRDGLNDADLRDPQLRDDNLLGRFAEQTFIHNPSLKSIDLSFGQLDSDRFARCYQIYNLKNLRSLNLAGNFLTRIPEALEHLSSVSLEFLNLSGNRIGAIALTLQILVNLKFLDLSGNGIREIAPRAFANLQNVENLNLSNNSLTRLTAEIMIGLEGLTSLDLTDNPELREIEIDTFDKMVNLVNFYSDGIGCELPSHLKDLLINCQF